MPGTFKAHGQQSNPSTPEDASPLSGNGFTLPGSCLVSPSALTRKKERSEPASTTNASKLKSRHEDAPQLRKAQAAQGSQGSQAPVPKKEVTSQSETASPPSEVASTAVPRTSSTLCSEGSLSERQQPGRPAQAQPESRNEVPRGAESMETGPLRWPETPPAARRREQSAEVPVRSPRPLATNWRSPSHPRNPNPSRPAEEKASVHLKKDRESLLKSVAALFQHGQSANVNSLDFYAVGRLLGKGAFGKVNVAVHKLTEELSAMKQCDRRRMTEA